jgi:hypothetical protein
MSKIVTDLLTPFRRVILGVGGVAGLLLMAFTFWNSLQDSLAAVG